MPYYCTVPRCTSMAGKAKNVSFHQFPRDEELAKLWNKILKRGKPYTKYSKVCSLHFTPEDYTITSVGKNKGQWRTLRKDAIPSQNLPSESPTPYQRKQWGSWNHNAPTNVLDPTIQQHVAQAIYMQTMLAMQAAGAADIPTLTHTNGLPQLSAPAEAFPHTSNTTDTDIGKQTNTSEKSTSYKCTECSKCFKDPDVFILHSRSHIKREKNEKENFNLNLTLQANPILANLLRTNTENTNIFDGNVFSMENLLMTALAANMEGYMRSFTSMIKNEDVNNLNHDKSNLGRDRVNLNHDRGNLEHDRRELSPGRGNLDNRHESAHDRDYMNNGIDNYEQNRLDTNNKGLSISNRDNSQNDNQNNDSIDDDRGNLNHDDGNMSHDSETNSDLATDMSSSRNLIRDRIIEMYRNNDGDDDDNVRNIRYYENDGENSDGTNDRGVISDRGVMGDEANNGDITNDDDSRDTDSPTCDSDLNESMDSNKLVIDEAA